MIRLTNAASCLLLAAFAGACEAPPDVVDIPVGDIALPAFETAPPLVGDPGQQQLVDAQIARDVAQLLDGLKSADPAIAVRAALALGSTQDPATVTRLAARLDDERLPVARAAAFALGSTGAPRAADHLLGALVRRSDPALQTAVVRALGFTATEDHLAQLIARDLPGHVAAEAALAVARAGTRGIHSDETVRWLLERIADADPDVRTNAAYFFERAADPATWAGSADEVRAQLDRETPDAAGVRSLLAGLAAVGDVVDTPRFAHWTRVSSDWRTRVAAVEALRDRAGDREARAALMASLDDPSPHVAEAAATELARSRPALQQEQDAVVAWIDANGDRWQAVATLLGGLAPLGEGERIAAWVDALPAEAVPARVAGYDALSRVPGSAFLDRLFEAAADPEPRIAAIAYRGLSGHWGGSREDASLVDRYDRVFRQGLSHGHPTVVGTAARGLTDPVLLARGSAEAIHDALVARNPSDPRQVPAVRALVSSLAGTRDPGWVPTLERYLLHPARTIRDAAAEAIESITHERPTLPALDEPPHPALRMSWAEFPSDPPQVVMETEKGTVRMVLAPDEAPLTVQTFLSFVGAGVFDGVPFHRVVPNFVVQGGDFERLDGTGGPGFAVRTEITRIPFRRGVLGMASSGKDTEGSQFFVMHSAAPHLESRYTSFGWVVDGMDVVDRLHRGDRIVRMFREN